MSKQIQIGLKRKGKGNMKRKQIILIITACVVLIAASVGGYFWYQNVQKQKILDSITLTWKDQTVIEYGSQITADELVEKVNGELTAPTLDTHQIGKQTLEYKVSKDEFSKTFKRNIEIKDTQAPIIDLKKDSLSLEYGADFQPSQYVKSIKDVVDGELSYQDVKKVQDHQKDYYTYQNPVNTKKEGQYQVVFKAVDRHGNTSQKTLKVQVKSQKKVETNTTTSSKQDTSKKSSSSQKQYTVSPDHKVIVIDPGHQGQGNSALEPIGPGASTKKAKVAGGATGVSSRTPESQITLEIGLKLKSELQARGYTVIMTRTSQNVNISNKERALIGNRHNASAVIHLHCDGASASARGAHTIAPAKNNPYCSSIYTASSRLAQKVINAYSAKTGIKSRGVSYRNDLSGLNWSEVPAIYLEMGFITNPTEDKLLNDSSFQTTCAQGIADGIDAYF